MNLREEIIKVYKIINQTSWLIISDPMWKWRKSNSLILTIFPFLDTTDPKQLHPAIHPSIDISKINITSRQIEVVDNHIVSSTEGEFEFLLSSYFTTIEQILHHMTTFRGKLIRRCNIDSSHKLQIVKVLITVIMTSYTHVPHVCNSN